MNRNIAIPAALAAVVLLLIGGIAIFGGGDDGESSSASTIEVTTSATQATPPAETTTAPAPAAEGRVVNASARTLGRKGSSGVTFTEFLDFECEACGAAYPAIEQLRQKYDGRVTFNLRYFPLPGHRNAEPAATAVEAAAQQGELEAMYQHMYETQSEWGEQQDSKASTFRGFAKELKLDMKRFDAAVKNPATLARVQRDVALGTSLGVQSTPTFFINEEMIQPESIEQLQQLLDAAIAQS